ncbi:MAG: vitamin K epoxide reductase family protein [Nocardiopsaceae bacterium]|nr:vitamin K epoxide reductase family protein [Nocardiopsaceae bacterium]
MASSKARSRRRGAGPSTGQIPLATPTMPAKPAAEDPEIPETEADDPERIVPEPVVEAPPPPRPPRWLQYLTLVLALGGLGVSAYETWSHFNGSHLAGCPSSVNATFDCTAVITSSQSMVFGVIPVAVLGLAFYVFAVAIFSPWAWRMRRPEVGWLRLGSMVVGMGFVMYLIYAEVYQIQQICEYCTAVHVITFLLFCATVVSAALWGLTPSRADS